MVTSAPPLGTPLPELLTDWRWLNARLAYLDERQVRQLIILELRGRCRLGYLKRLHQRWLTLVRLRSWEELQLVASSQGSELRTEERCAAWLESLLRESI